MELQQLGAAMGHLLDVTIISLCTQTSQINCQPGIVVLTEVPLVIIVPPMCCMLPGGRLVTIFVGVVG